MKAVFIEHAEKRSLGVEEIVHALTPEVDLVIIQSYLGQALPDVNEFDFIISGGGPMGAYEMHKPEYSFLAEEADLLNKSIQKGKGILGICLGHQLLSRVLGAKVERDESTKEIGWSRVNLTDSGKNDHLFSGCDSEFLVFQYHYDETKDLAPDSTNLATSRQCAIQAIRYKNLPVYGIQFHPEISPSIGRSIITSRKEKLEHEGVDVSSAVALGYEENQHNRQLIFYNFLHP